MTDAHALQTNLPKLEPPFIPVANAITILMNTTRGTHHSLVTVRRRIRQRRSCGGGVPTTPHLHWSFYSNNDDDDDEKIKKHHGFSSSVGDGGKHIELSARKLAAGLWHLQLLRRRSGGFSSKRRSSDRSCSGPGTGNVNVMLSQNNSSKEHSSDIKCQPRRRRSTILRSNEGNLHKLESLLPHSKSVKEGATKWDSRCSKASIETYCFVSHMKLLEDQLKSLSFVSALQAELSQSQLYIHDLESEVRSLHKKVKYLQTKLGEEAMLQQKKESDKIYALIDDLKGQLSRERKMQQRLDVTNSQLIKELTEAKVSSIQLVKKYEEEKRAKELLEEVCNELAMKVGEDQSELEALRIETMKIREEVEEERNMLQVAEVWREERVQMKLTDAKLALESKYYQMNKLITVLETFLSRSTSLDLTEVRKLIRQAVKSVNIQEMEEFSYNPLRSGDILSILKELRQVGVCEMEIEPRVNYFLTGDVSNHHPLSPERNDHDNNHVPKHSGGFVDYDSGMGKDTRGEESVNAAENRDSVQESGCSIITVGGCKNASRSEIERDKAINRDSPINETSEVCSISAENSKWKTCSAKLDISCVSNSGSNNAVSDKSNEIGKPPNGTASFLRTNFPNRKSNRDALKHKKPMGQCSSAYLVNPHIARAINGCSELPKGFEKNILKAKLSETKTENQNPQLQVQDTGS